MILNFTLDKSNCRMWKENKTGSSNKKINQKNLFCKERALKNQLLLFNITLEKCYCQKSQTKLS